LIKNQQIQAVVVGVIDANFIYHTITNRLSDFSRYTSYFQQHRKQNLFTPGGHAPSHPGVKSPQTDIFGTFFCLFWQK